MHFMYGLANGNETGAQDCTLNDFSTAFRKIEKY